MSVFARAALGVSLALSSLSALADFQPDDIVGYWRTIDDKTGFAKAIVRIQKATNGTYIGTIVRTVPRPDYTPRVSCYNCPVPFKDRKIIGLPLLWNLKAESDSSARWQYNDGYVIDPLSGKIYHGKTKLSSDGRRLMLRGFVGVSALGRTQTWIREDNNSALVKDIPAPTAE